MPNHNKIDYVEFAARDMQATKQFFTEVFGWSFEDYGPEYTAFSNQGVDGGFYSAEKNSNFEANGSLIIFFSEDLESTQSAIEQAGGTISQQIFSFPGGRRFHFTEPSGNEMAVWSNKDENGEVIS